MQSPLGPTLPAVPGRRRRRLFQAAAAAVLAYAAVDWLLIGTLAVYLLPRVAWAAVLAGAGEVAARARSERTVLVVGCVAAASSPFFQAAIALGCGPPGNPEYAWLLAMPIACALIAQEVVLASVSTGLASMACAGAAVALAGGSAAQVRAWVVSVFVTSLLGVAASVLFRHFRNRALAAREVRRRMQQELAESERRRTQAERMALVGRLASGVAHEINNPLAFVLANLEVLETDVRSGALPLSEEKVIFAETRDGLERIRRIVADLRAFAREEPPGDDRCAVSEVAEEAARIARFDAEVRHGLRVEVAPGLPQVAMGRRLLEEVLVNLLVNAGDAALEPGAARPAWIRLAARRDRGGVELVVEDNGPGLRPEALARLFEPFFTTKGPRQGTGLGLAVSRERLRAAGGDLEGSNRPEGGARFRVWLPEAAEAPAAVSAAA